jgi:L,D-transpeptidase-like protein
MHSTAPFNRTPKHHWIAILLIALFLGIALFLIATLRTAAAKSNAAPGSCDTHPVSTSETRSVLPLSYVQSLPGKSVSIYSQPGDVNVGAPPAATYPAGFVWFSLADTQPVCEEGQPWFRVNPDGYVPATAVTNFQPSQFRGMLLPGKLDSPFAWVVFKTRPSSAPGAKPAKDTPALPQYTPVTIFEERQVGNFTWYRIGENQWIEQRQIGVIRQSPRPAEVGADEKWIEVNLFEQTLAAYEGDRIVYGTLVSSGLPYWPTPTGLFRIWLKQEDGKMSGREGLPDYYYLQDVPWIMYFDGPIALHGAYWHDRFGEAHSHGCVNLTPQDAQWLFDWTTPTGSGNWQLAKPENPGTWVWVHN